MATARISGLDIYYEQSGSGPRLLYLNGTGATLASTAALLAPLASDFEVVAFDQRGIGRTPSSDHSYGMADLAADALALADQLGWEHFRLVGLSFGGMVAQEVAVTAPGRIDRLALLCTSAGGAGGSSFPLESLVDMDPADRAAASAQLLDTRFSPDWLAGHDDDRALVGMLAQHFTSDKSEQVLKGEAAQLRARSGHDVYDRLSSVTCPTLVASGSHDGIAPPANGAAMARRILDATFRLFDGGHLFLLQDPAAFPEIIEFLKEG